MTRVSACGSAPKFEVIRTNRIVHQKETEKANLLSATILCRHVHIGCWTGPPTNLRSLSLACVEVDAGYNLFMVGICLLTFGLRRKDESFRLFYLRSRKPIHPPSIRKSTVLPRSIT